MILGEAFRERGAIPDRTLISVTAAVSVTTESRIWSDFFAGSGPVDRVIGWFDSDCTNVGEINNTGFEVSVNASIISNDNFTWSADFNWATNTNKVVSLVNGADWFDSAAPSYFSLGDTYILREGEAVGQDAPRAP